MDEEKSYEFLLEHYELSVIQERVLYWHAACKAEIDRLGIQDIAVINTDALLRMILCYYSDIVRLKEYHGIAHVSEYKKYAFGAFWFLRLHPVNLIDPNADSKYTYINEKIVLQVFASEFLANKFNEQRVKEYLIHLFYHLKYRTYTGRALELTLNALSI